jgi:coproporphyrinogen III oxidase-like Fe-S oxidoreductase
VGSGRAGAHAFDGETRRWNAARLDGYIAALTPADGMAPRLPPGSPQPEEPAGRPGEAAILALRTSAGLPATDLSEPSIGATLRWAIGAGLLEQTPAERLALTLRGRLLADELFIRLV